MTLFRSKSSNYERVSQSQNERKKNNQIPSAYIIIAFVVVAYSLLSIQNYIHLQKYFIGKQISGRSCSQPMLDEQPVIQKQIRRIIINPDQYDKPTLEIQQLGSMNSINQNKGKLTDKRILFGQPLLNTHEKFKAYVIQAQFKTSNQFCGVFNGLTGITNITIQTIKSLLISMQISKVIVFISPRDIHAKKLLSTAFSEKQLHEQMVSLDSDYNFIRKFTKSSTKIIYAFPHFIINGQMAINLKQQLYSMPPLSLLYTSKILKKTHSQQLINLQQIDLQSIKLQHFYSYMYIIDTAFLNVISPLNFAYYSRYTLEQAIIFPILAILQQSQKGLIPIQKIVHKIIDPKQYIIRQDFRLKSPQKQQNSICFVSYPNNPFIISEQQFDKYFSSVKENNNASTRNISSIIYMPYNFGKSQSLYNIVTKILKQQLWGKLKMKRIRFRIMANKTVSSHAVYDSTYSYCPNQTIIVSSRHNIQVAQNFIQQVLANVEQQFHYFYANSQNYLGEVTKFTNLPNNLKVSIRKSPDLFQTYFQNIQIFKSDLMKTSLFWVLKCAQLDFYQTEAPFVFIMLQQTRLKFKYINKTLVYIQQRESTATELQQIKNVRSYIQYHGLKQNKLMPYPYSCLENKAYMRFAPEKIQKIIHQVWLGKDKVSPVRLKLHETIVQKNKNFDVKLWKFENVTRQNFPLTYDIVQRVLEYHKTAQKSFFTLAADLLRYQLVYNYGGIYIDFKMEGAKPMDDFLKYEVFFLDCDISELRFLKPKVIGIGIFGAVRNSYYIKTILTQLIVWQNFDFIKRIPLVSGSFVARSAFNDQQFFTVLGLGYQLLYPLPYQQLVNACGGVDKKFSPDQQVFSIYDYHAHVDVKIGIPCREYPEAYLISYAPLAKTWIYQKRQIN